MASCLLGAAQSSLRLPLSPPSPSEACLRCRLLVPCCLCHHPPPSLRFGQQLTQCCFSSLAQGRFDALPSRFATSIMHRVLQCVSSLHVGIAQAGLNALAFMRQSGVVFDPTNLGRVHRVLEVCVLCHKSSLYVAVCRSMPAPVCNRNSVRALRSCETGLSPGRGDGGPLHCCGLRLLASVLACSAMIIRFVLRQRCFCLRFIVTCAVRPFFLLGQVLRERCLRHWSPNIVEMATVQGQALADLLPRLPPSPPQEQAGADAPGGGVVTHMPLPVLAASSV